MATKKPAKLALTDNKKASANFITKRLCECGCLNRIPAKEMFSTRRTIFGVRGKSSTRIYHFIKGHENQTTKRV